MQTPTNLEKPTAKSYEYLTDDAIEQRLFKTPSENKSSTYKARK